MATITPTTDPIANSGGVAFWALWETITDGDSGAAVQNGEFADRSVQVFGTWDGNTITIQGSNDGTNWFTLNDLQGSALTFTADGLKGIAEATRYIRPLDDGAGTTIDIDVLLYMKRVGV